MHQVSVKIFYFTTLILPTLYASVFLGLLHEWLDFLNLQIWIIWFLMHLFLYSMVILYQDVDWINMASNDRKQLFTIGLLTTLWFYQKVYTLVYYPSGNFDKQCRREFMILQSSFVLTLVVVLIGSGFAGLIRL